jgi:hypothetical protein
MRKKPEIYVYGDKKREQQCLAIFLTVMGFMFGLGLGIAMGM